jgi:hypothetical protein
MEKLTFFEEEYDARTYEPIIGKSSFDRKRARSFIERNGTSSPACTVSRTRKENHEAPYIKDALYTNISYVGA